MTAMKVLTAETSEVVAVIPIGDAGSANSPQRPLAVPVGERLDARARERHVECSVNCKAHGRC